MTGGNVSLRSQYRNSSLEVRVAEKLSRGFARINADQKDQAASRMIDLIRVYPRKAAAKSLLTEFDKRGPSKQL